MSIFSPSGWNLESPNRDNSTARADDRLVHLNRRSSYSYKCKQSYVLSFISNLIRSTLLQYWRLEIDGLQLSFYAL